jgi:hypothetical protein
VRRSRWRCRYSCDSTIPTAIPIPTQSRISQIRETSELQKTKSISLSSWFLIPNAITYATARTISPIFTHSQGWTVSSC